MIARVYFLVCLLSVSWLYYVEYLNPRAAFWPKMPYERDSTMLEHHVGIWMMGLTLPLCLPWMAAEAAMPHILARIPPEYIGRLVTG
jgi:hypothetical protein